jgi:hypothetical protein
VGILNAAWAPLSAIAVALISALGAWYLAQRKGSGTVKTSEASELWNANSEFRKMLMDEAKARSVENAVLRAEAAKCHEEQAELDKRVKALEKELAQRGAGGT